jgi:hypothetical protein
MGLPNLRFSASKTESHISFPWYKQYLILFKKSQRKVCAWGQRPETSLDSSLVSLQPQFLPVHTILCLSNLVIYQPHPSGRFLQEALPNTQTSNQGPFSVLPSAHNPLNCHILALDMIRELPSCLPPVDHRLHKGRHCSASQDYTSVFTWAVELQPADAA